jgi:hypothetical protein
MGDPVSDFECTGGGFEKIDDCEIGGASRSAARMNIDEGAHLLAGNAPFLEQGRER